MMAAQKVTVRFWGARGGIPCPGPATVRYGGNTPCVEVRIDDHSLVFDAGTGIRALGRRIDRRAPVALDVFFAHASFERICGIPFFAAAYNARNRVRFWAGNEPGGVGIREVLTGLMTEPLFPVPLEVMGARFTFTDFTPGDTLSPAPGVRVRTAALNAAAPGIGYRVEAAGRSVAYVSDVVAAGDLGPARALVAGADLAIVNTADNAPGPADWREALGLAAGRTRRAILFHLPPCDDDDAMDTLAAAARERCAGAIVAHEGLEIAL